MRYGLCLLLLPLLAFGGAVGACGGGGGVAVEDPDPTDPPVEPPVDPPVEPPTGPPPYENQDAIVFVEVAASAGMDSIYSSSSREWGQRKMCAAGAAGDFNRDGWQDLFVTGGGTSEDKLFLNDGDGTFTEVGAAWGVDVAHMGTGVAVGDYDGDGWLDVFVSSLGAEEVGPVIGQHRLYHNTGQGSFEERAALAGVTTSSPTVPDGMGAAFGDYDLDGDLDLYVCGWADPTTGSRLFRNDGDGTFTDVTASAVPAKAMHSFSPRFVDMNGDRYPELLIAADYLTSAYFVNRTDGTFSDRTATSGVALDTNGMGSTVADFDNDGLLDWYVSSIYVGEPGDGSDPTGNMLYANLGGDVYSEISATAGVQDGGWGWGIVAVDVDHDGLVDLAETNGWHVGIDTSPYANVMCRLFLNGGQGAFLNVAEKSGFDDTGQGRGLIRFDLDNDGDQDLVLFQYAEPMRLFRNDTDTGNHWLRLLFDTSADAGLAPDGFGTRVRVTAGDLVLHGTLAGGCTHLSQSELSLHFGLREAALADEVLVRWTDGRTTTLTDVTIDQTLTIQSPGP
jgi:hypothetical protein